MSLKTYIGNFLGLAIAPGGSYQCQFSIVCPGREILLKSVLWQHLIINTTTGQRVPDEQLNDLTSEFKIGSSVPSGVVGLDFNSVAPPAPSTADRMIALFKSGQYYFNDISINNEILINNAYVNSSAANAYDIYIGVTIEIEEKIIY